MMIDSLRHIQRELNHYWTHLPTHGRRNIKVAITMTAFALAMQGLQSLWR